MHELASFRSVLAAAGAVCALCAAAETAKADTTFIQTNLASDIPGLAAITDPNLINTWGISHLPGSPFWISNQGANTSSLFAVSGSANVSAVPLTVAIPTTANGPQGPTGQVSNSGSSFTIAGGPALFMFANLNGTISAWNGASGTTASIEVTTPGAHFTGLAINQAQNMLYAANGAGGIDVFNGSFAPVSLGSGAFATPAAINAKHLVPFNVQDINGSVYVTYAPASHAAQENAALGQGAVAVFSESGTLQSTLLGGPLAPLAAPWGIALAPADFGVFGGDLLVGNFSFTNSEINAFNPMTGALVGSLGIDPGAGNTPGGTLGAHIWRRRQWKPGHALLHRWPQRRGRRPIWRHSAKRPRALELGDDAARLRRSRLCRLSADEGAACLFCRDLKSRAQRNSKAVSQRFEVARLYFGTRTRRMN